MSESFESNNRRENSIEYFEKWRELRANAEADAQRHIAEIENYFLLEADEKIQALEKRAYELSYDENGKLKNENRYLVRHISNKAEALRVRVREEHLEKLGVRLAA